ncbi:MAG: SDR family NAD(P)-dependent oxidoreductase [Geminicoccaceae bacterium]
MADFTIYPSLDGRSVVVTGGGSGIGAQIVRRFCQQRSHVAFLDVDREASEALIASIAAEGLRRPVFLPCDLRDIEALRSAIRTAGTTNGDVSILINNAARDDRHAFDTVTPEYWDERFAVNLKHQFFAAQACYPMMKKNGYGSIVNMGSTSWMVGQGGMAAYTAAKSAVLGLTRSLARDWGPDNIRVNSIAPGWIMTERQISKWLTPEGEKELMTRQCLKRKLVPDDIARVVLFLASDDSSAMTNQSYIVDGGWV